MLLQGGRLNPSNTGLRTYIVILIFRLLACRLGQANYDLAQLSRSLVSGFFYCSQRKSRFSTLSRGRV